MTIQKALVLLNQASAELLSASPAELPNEQQIQVEQAPINGAYSVQLAMMTTPYGIITDAERRVLCFRLGGHDYDTGVAKLYQSFQEEIGKNIGLTMELVALKRDMELLERSNGELRALLADSPKT